MNQTIPKNVWHSHRRLSLYNALTFMAATTKKRGCLFLCLVMAALFSTAQSISPSTINISGQSATFGNYQFEWSVGESTFITTMTNSNLVVTGGVLQFYVANQPDLNTVGTWLSNEIRIYPNPTRDIIEINILHKLTGKNKIELIDIQGRKVMETQFQYYGRGRIVKWDLSKLIAGEYFLYIQQLSPVTGRAVKKGTFKIQKIN